MSLVKCVVWDIDNTLLTGVYLESGDQPPGADPVLAGVLAELGGRGILHALASKNPPEAAAHTARVTGWDFAAARCGWGAKSEALTQIAAGLGLGVDTLAFVDDDPYERAEVSSALPQVMVLSPEEAAEAAGWPEFSPPVLTAEARRRGVPVVQRAQMLAEQPEFHSNEQMRALLELTERRDVLQRALARRSTPGLSVTIGAENIDPKLTQFTIVTSAYRSESLAGVIGVMGPTRMPYQKVIALVEYTSRLMSNLAQ